MLGLGLGFGLGFRYSFVLVIYYINYITIYTTMCPATFTYTVSPWSLIPVSQYCMSCILLQFLLAAVVIVQPGGEGVSGLTDTLHPQR